MEAADNNEVTTNLIVKGKRTKRQRVQSPIHNFSLNTHSSSFDGDFGEADAENTIDGVAASGTMTGDYDCTKNNATNITPPSSQEFRLQDRTEEEEDMANCLILLAKGHFQDLPKQDHHVDGVATKIASTTLMAATGGGGGNHNNNKFNSRRFLESGASGSGKGGYYVYECKTCCRTFSSFQALGGHRASHKKPKGEDKKQFTVSSDEEDGHFKDISSLSLQLSNNNNSNNKNNKAKIHECSICGAEFTSGQALGGHMRRHRAPIGAAPAAASNTNLSLTPMVMESEEPKKARNLISLDLDLNLPAPDDEKQLPFASKQQQQQKQDQRQKSALVFSSPALVDCHY